MSLPLVYEIGREAAFSAVDAHGVSIDLRLPEIQTAAWKIVIDMRLESGDEEVATLPDSPAHLRVHLAFEYGQGYEDGLQEMGK